MTSQTTLGTSIGRHRIARLLGGGSLGRVFACKSPEQEQLVAIKILRTKYEALGDALIKQRNALEKIESPHAVKIHDVAVFNNVVYIVMELVEGDSLQERLKQGMMRTVDALSLARAIVLGLQAGWAQGIAHGDLRPANVLLPRNELKDAKVVDFQLAVPVEGTEAVRGSPSYLAPELLVGTPCDAMSDLYALGCLMHEVLTGKPPFVGPPSSVLNAQANTTPPTLAATMPGAPQGLVDLVDRLLEKDRSKRIKTHGEALAGIDRALAGQGMAAPRLPDIPSYEVDVDVEFDHERTDEWHMSPPRESLDRMMTPPARPAMDLPAVMDLPLPPLDEPEPVTVDVEVPAELKAPVAPVPIAAVAPVARVSPVARSPVVPGVPVSPMRVGLDNAPTQVRAPPSSIPIAPMQSIGLHRSSSPPRQAIDDLDPPVVPAKRSRPVAMLEDLLDPDVRPSGRPAPAEEISDDDDGEEQHTRIDANIVAQPLIPSAEDLGLVLTPVVPKKK